jgi:hypothetical protein
MVPWDSFGSRLVRLAIKRVNNALQAIRLVGNLSNRTNYDYDPKQVAKIIKALQSELNHTKEKFTTGNGQDAGGFSL